MITPIISYNTAKKLTTTENNLVLVPTLTAMVI